MHQNLKTRLMDFHIHETQNLNYLRDKLCGSTIDQEKLEDLGYKLIKNSNKKWQLWVKFYNRKREGYAIKVSLAGHLGAIEHFMYFDLREDFGFMAPCGYVRTGDISEVVKKKIESELLPIVIEPLPSIWEDAALFYIRLFISDFDKKLEQSPNPDESKEFFINSLIEGFSERQEYDRLAFIGLGLSKFIDSFTDKNLLLYFGGLLSTFKYGDIFTNCLRKALTLNSEWDELNYFNVGLPLREAYQNYELAHAVDTEALELFPESAMIKKNILLSGQYLVRNLACDSTSVLDAIKLGEHLMQVTHGVDIPAKFSLFLGLAYESAEMFDKAEQQYLVTLEKATNSHEFNGVLQRAKSKQFNPIEARRFLSLNIYYQGIISTVEDHLIGDINKPKS